MTRREENLALDAACGAGWFDEAVPAVGLVHVNCRPNAIADRVEELLGHPVGALAAAWSRKNHGPRYRIFLTDRGATSTQSCSSDASNAKFCPAAKLGGSR